MSEDPEKSALNKLVRDYEDLKGRTDGRLTRSQACPLGVICN